MRTLRTAHTIITPSFLCVSPAQIRTRFFYNMHLHHTRLVRKKRVTFCYIFLQIKISFHVTLYWCWCCWAFEREREREKQRSVSFSLLQNHSRVVALKNFWILFCVFNFAITIQRSHWSWNIRNWSLRVLCTDRERKLDTTTTNSRWPRPQSPGQRQKQ